MDSQECTNGRTSGIVQNRIRGRKRARRHGACRQRSQSRSVAAGRIIIIVIAIVIFIVQSVSRCTGDPNYFACFCLQLCFVQLKTLAPSARYSTFKYPVTLKPGLGVTQGHRKLYQWIRHPRLPINVP